DVGSCVEEADLDRPDIAIDPVAELLHFVLTPRINTERVHIAPETFQLFDQSARFRSIPSCYADGVSAGGEPPRDSRPDRISSSNQQGGFVLFNHEDLSHRR